MTSVLTGKARSAKIAFIVVSASWMMVGCGGGAASPESPESQSVPEPQPTASSEASGQACQDLLPQQESLNYFPPLILSDREGAPESLDEAIVNIEAVDATADPELAADLETLAATMDLGRGEAENFDYDAFVEAKIAVDAWISDNCL